MSQVVSLGEEETRNIRSTECGASYQYYIRKIYLSRTLMQGQDLNSGPSAPKYKRSNTALPPPIITYYS